METTTPRGLQVVWWGKRGWAQWGRYQLDLGDYKPYRWTVHFGPVELRRWA